MSEIAVGVAHMREAIRKHGQAADRAAAISALPLSMPLVLDLDGTLIAGDLLYKSFFSILRRNPLIVFSCAAWLLGGRAALKRAAGLAQPDRLGPLAFHQDVSISRIGKKRPAGLWCWRPRPTPCSAEQLAARSACIDRIFASDGEQNLKGSAKAELLERLYPDGFIYAGDSKADLAVWARAPGSCWSTRASVRNAARTLGEPMLELSGRV